MWGDLTDFVLGQISDYEQLRDFGLDPKNGDEIIQQVKDYVMRMMLRKNADTENMVLLVNDEALHGMEAAVEKIKELTAKNLSDDICLVDDNALTQEDLNLDSFDSIYEASGWTKVHEFINQLPPLEKGKAYCLQFRMKNVKLPEDFSFALLCKK